MAGGDRRQPTTRAPTTELSWRSPSALTGVSAPPADNIPGCAGDSRVRVPGDSSAFATAYVRRINISREPMARYAGHLCDERPRPVLDQGARSTGAVRGVAGGDRAVLRSGADRAAAGGRLSRRG